MEHRYQICGYQGGLIRAAALMRIGCSCPRDASCSSEAGSHGLNDTTARVAVVDIGKIGDILGFDGRSTSRSAWISLRPSSEDSRDMLRARSR